MAVSVIIPNYNHALYLEKRIQSVLNQTYRELEVIILDDASTDNSLEVINRYKDHPRVTQVLVNQKNSGSTFKQWEKGVLLAKHEYVWIAESDDYADENFLASAMERFAADKSLGLYFCDHYGIDEKGNITLTENYPRHFVQSFVDATTMDGKKFCEQYLFFSCLVLNASAVVFKKNLFINADKTYQQLKVSGDWRMWVNICSNTQVFFDKQKLDYFRMHDNNVRSAKASLMGAEAVLNMVYFTKKVTDRSIKLKLKESICKTWVYSFYLNKNPKLNFTLIRNILSVDVLFPARLIRRILNKALSQS